MNWEQLITTMRFGLERYHRADGQERRNEFQRDYDRLVFSAPFRRLQNKTQVFPLPGSVFVHNRLTHSLEVSCVGRSLGNNAGGTGGVPSGLGDIVSAACLAHDMGNPPFGHSGERAIQTWFSEGKGRELEGEMTAAEWADCICFEGNANAFRILTHQYRGRRQGGFVLTYPTVASIVKYPFAAIDSPKGKKKFGFFDADRGNWEQIRTRLGIPEGVRYPLVWLVEAADDICYEIMDMEDAHKLRILSTEETKALLLNFFPPERIGHITSVMQMVDDTNEQIAYLRSCVIGELIDACTQVFAEQQEAILEGNFSGSLIKHTVPRIKEAYAACSKVAVERIYRSQEVLDVELAGYKIIYMLMEELMQAVLHPDKTYSQQLLQRIPQQYDTSAETVYGRTLAILDYISGMTDVYALDLYQKITGISLPMV
ncbi:MAG: dNTP triphosphohydrolase [Paludibacteraceae bacterium]|nr:dNTP triphosphohydrolase [Paludibacteraceae bacterium]